MSVYHDLCLQEALIPGMVRMLYACQLALDSEYYYSVCTMQGIIEKLSLPQFQTDATTRHHQRDLLELFAKERMLDRDPDLRELREMKLRVQGIVTLTKRWYEDTDLLLDQNIMEYSQSVADMLAARDEHMRTAASSLFSEGRYYIMQTKKWVRRLSLISMEQMTDVMTTSHENGDVFRNGSYLYAWPQVQRLVPSLRYIRRGIDQHEMLVTDANRLLGLLDTHIVRVKQNMPRA